MSASAAFSSHPVWRKLQTRVRALTGMVLSPRTGHSALTSLHELATRRGMSDDAYLDQLDGKSHLEDRQALIDQLVVGTTWFMREATGLTALAETLLRERGTGQSVRIWCAGCSTGQEAYGLAMALVEAGLKPQIIATDISRTAIRTAQAATYTTQSLRALPADWQRKHTQTAGADSATIHGNITQRVRFAVHNLTDAQPPSGAILFDAVVCRNVLIYFEREAAIAVVRRMTRACRPGGYVLLSAAERPLAWMLDTLEETDGDLDRVLLRSIEIEPRPIITAERPAPKADKPRPVLPQIVKPLPVARDTTAHALAEATQAMEAGAISRALEILDGLLAHDPLLAAAHLVRGLALKRAGVYQEATATLRCARFLLGDASWLAPYHLALLLELRGEPEDACEAYRHALGIIQAGGASGLPASDGAEQLLTKTVAEACSARIRALSFDP